MRRILTVKINWSLRRLGRAAGLGDYPAGNPDHSLEFLQQLMSFGQEIAHNFAEVPAFFSSLPAPKTAS